MKNFSSNIINIKGSSLICNTDYYLDINLQKKKSLIIQGTVYNGEYKVVPHASIQVIEINTITKKRKTLGYYITNKCGKYAFNLELKINCCYELNAYSPLI